MTFRATIFYNVSPLLAHVSLPAIPKLPQCQPLAATAGSREVQGETGAYLWWQEEDLCWYVTLSSSAQDIAYVDVRIKLIYTVIQYVIQVVWKQQLICTDFLFKCFLVVLIYTSACVSALDDAVGNVTKALQDKGMLENSIIVFSTDNGGAANGYNMNMANNWPLRWVENSITVFSTDNGGAANG